MDEYIKREDVLNDMLLVMAGTGYQSRAMDVIKFAYAADVVEVVRCKDCEYCHMSTDPKTLISVQVCGYVGYNPVQSSQVTDNDFCSHGERRE